MSPNETHRSHLFLRLVVVVLLLLGWSLASSDRIPVSVGSAAHARTAAFDDQQPHNLSALRVFSRVVVFIKDNYYDPKRIQPRKMLVAALDGIERQVAEVMAEGDEKSSKIKVTVNKMSQEFDISRVNNLWNVSFVLKEVFNFISQNLSETSKKDSREIEYAAANGMLSTLDPHSVLLKPEINKEMKLQTRGEFGGLGFVIHMKDSNLIILRVLKNTPASRAGIRPKDHITRIANESTVNMDLSEAVNRIRGKPGSKITLYIKRKKWKSPKKMVLKRAIINVESVVGKLLDNNIGYIRVRGFQGQSDGKHNTARDMQAELRRLEKEVKTHTKNQNSQLQGLVLDLRDNPGGLLEQAIQVSDTFLSKGTVVTTVGFSDKMREVKKASADETDSKLPLAVLVNSSSASASEIVAGAMRNLNRGVIIGRQTFGKGSVQVLYDFPDESSLKLTIAQYLTPGDISIQETGITPDIELLPSLASKRKMDFFSPKRTAGEADLVGHFGNPDSDTVATKKEEVVLREKPLEQLRYFLEAKASETESTKDLIDEEEEIADLETREGEDSDDEIVEDYPIQFARDLLVAAPYSTRKKILSAAKPFLQKRRNEEYNKIHNELEKLGIDWSRGQSKTVSKPQISVETTPASTVKNTAGDVLTWTVTVKNNGRQPLYRLRAYSESENRLLDRREFVFGKIEPGQKRSWTVKLRIPKAMVSRKDEVRLKFFDEGKSVFQDLVSEINIAELPWPAFGYTWQIVDNCAKCNGDGTAHLDETVQLAVQITNTGTGKAFNVLGLLKNKADEYISLSKGRVKLGEILPGQTKEAVFEFEIKPKFKGGFADLQLAIGDEDTDQWVSEKLSIPIEKKGKLPQKQNLSLKAMKDLNIYSAAQLESPIIGSVPKGSLIFSDARFGSLYRILVGTNSGYISNQHVTPSKSSKKETKTNFQYIASRIEPTIELAVNTLAGGITTNEDSFKLQGKASSVTSLRDVYIFVNDQKVFFKSAPKGEKKINFNTKFPLKEGNNQVVVVAREDQDFMARRALIIRRTKSHAVAQKAMLPSSRKRSK